MHKGWYDMQTHSSYFTGARCGHRDGLHCGRKSVNLAPEHLSTTPGTTVDRLAGAKVSTWRQSISQQPRVPLLIGSRAQKCQLGARASLNNPAHHCWSARGRKSVNLAPEHLSTTPGTTVGRNRYDVLTIFHWISMQNAMTTSAENRIFYFETVCMLHHQLYNVEKLRTSYNFIPEYSECARSET